MLFMETEEQKLLDENMGYNPEPVSDFEAVHFNNDKTVLMIVQDNDTLGISTYYVTDCKNQLEFIKRFPRRFGVTYNNKFWVQAE